MKAASPKRNQAVGMAGEQAAVDYLLKQGYQVLARNARTPAGELDIIARNGNVLVFIEVKTRSSAVFGPAAGAVGAAKQAHICAASAWYMQQNELTGLGVRYDVITVDAADGMRVQHIPNAFEFIPLEW